MATVRDGEEPTRFQTEGDKLYLLFPDYGVNDLSVAGWGIKCYDSTDPDDVIMGWANGSRAKVNKADNLSSLTFTNIV